MTDVDKTGKLHLTIDLGEVWTIDDQTLGEVIREEVLSEVKRKARQMARDLLATDDEFRKAVAMAHKAATEAARAKVNEGLAALFRTPGA